MINGQLSKMKKIIIVNNNMKVGGVQKSLYNLLWSVSDQYDITLYLFSRTGKYVNQLPENVRVLSCTSLFRYLGKSQEECNRRISDRLIRGFLAVLCKILGRPFVIRIMSLSQKLVPEKYDIAISYLQNGRLHSLYGGVNEFVLNKITAREKIAFLHCDYCNCGADNILNNKLYYSFDKIAACSDGCRRAFNKAIPMLKDKCVTVRNFHRHQIIKKMSLEDPVVYEAGRFHVLVVGRLAHEKAIDRAIKAVRSGIANQLPISLHIVGDGNMRKSLEELAVSLNVQNIVHFYGEQENPYRFMTNADLLLVTSYHEAAPMVIDEARIIGIPVLTVETTSSEEMVVDNRCGWVCENSQEGINECMMKILSHTTLLEQMKASLKDGITDNREALRQFQAVIGEYDEDTGKTSR